MEQMNETASMTFMRISSYVSISMYALLMLLCILGSTVILVATFRCPTLKARRRIVLPMAFADLLLGLALPFLICVMLLPSLMSSLTACTALTVTVMLPLKLSLTLFCAMIVSKLFEGRGTNILVAGAVIYSITLTVTAASLIGWNDQTGCVYESVDNQSFMLIDSVSILIALTVVSFLHLCGRQMAAPETKKEDQLTGQLPTGALLLVYVLGWVPNCLFTIATIYGLVGDFYVLLGLRMLLNIVVYAPSACKVLMYAASIGDFRTVITIRQSEGASSVQQQSHVCREYAVLRESL